MLWLKVKTQCIETENVERKIFLECQKCDKSHVGHAMFWEQCFVLNAEFRLFLDLYEVNCWLTRLHNSDMSCVLNLVSNFIH